LVGTAATSTQTYKIERIFESSETGYVYRTTIGTNTITDRLAHDLDVCWGSLGSAKAKLHDEVKQTTDQAGGSVAAPQTWTAVKYRKSTGSWIALARTVGSNCTSGGGVIELSTMRCVYGPTLGDRFKTWDSRT
jgi:hypothetical protein